MTAIGPDESSYGNRGKPYSLLITARWNGPELDAANITWANELYTALRVFTDGSGYLNYMGVEDESIVRRSYGAQNYQRLVALKDHYDPDNVFCNNQNVRPSFAGASIGTPAGEKDPRPSCMGPER
jgi:hypothetical protein